ncbi:MAG: universal stress protein [Thaumarchaeota archaeon]|nr:universal stress protein [Nitrososphaerota archaeon]
MSASGNLSRILVAIDGSTNSMRAADAAIFTAKKAGAKLLVVNALHVPYSDLYLTEMGNYPEYTKKQAKEDAEKWFDEIRQKAKQNNVEIEGAEAIEPFPTIVGSIVNYAEHKNVDLIVVGSIGRTGFEKILLGSVALGIVRYSTRSVMIVK